MATILERLPAKFLRSQFGSLTALLCAVIEQHTDEVSPAWILCTFLRLRGNPVHHQTVQLTNLPVRQVSGGHSQIYFVLDVQASAVKPAIACLSAVLAAMDPSDWPSAKAPFELLVSFCLNLRPKVRKKAHDGVLHVLASIRDTAALAPASAVLLAGEPVLLMHLPRLPTG